IAVLATEGEDVKAASAGAPPAAKPTASSSPPPAAKPASVPTPPPPPAQGIPVAASQVAPAPTTNGHGRIFASPLARRLAKAAGIDVVRIGGTGPHGRIVARDVEAAKFGGAAARAPAPQTPAPQAPAPQTPAVTPAQAPA